MKYIVTDIIGQPHVFNVGGKTVRLYSRKSVEIEADSLPQEVALSEKKGFVLVEKVNSKSKTTAKANEG